MKAIAMIAAVVLAPPCLAQYEKFPAVPENQWAFQALFNLKVSGIWSDLPNGLFRKAPARMELAQLVVEAHRRLSDVLAAIEADHVSKGENLGELRSRASRFAGHYQDIRTLMRMADEFEPELIRAKVDAGALKRALSDLIIRNGAIRGDKDPATAVMQDDPVVGHLTRFELADAMDALCREIGWCLIEMDERLKRAGLEREQPPIGGWLKSREAANMGQLRAQASEFAGAAGVLQGTISSETSSTFLIVEAKSKDKTVDARLYLPSRFHRTEKETLGYLSLTNRSSQEKLLINGLWANTNIFPDRLDGEPLYKPMVLMFEGPLPTRAQIPVSPGSTLLRSFPLQHLWDFVYTEEGRYKLELIYDDAGLWPTEQQRHTVGKIRLGFDLVVEQSIVKFVPTEPKKAN